MSQNVICDGDRGWQQIFGCGARDETVSRFLSVEGELVRPVESADSFAGDWEKQQQIPFGDDNKKDKVNGKGNNSSCLRR